MFALGIAVGILRLCNLKHFMSKENSLPNWLLLSTPTAAVMVMALILCKNSVAAVATGITSAASSAGAISVVNRRRDRELDRIKEQLDHINNAQQLKAGLPHLQAKVESLKSDRNNLEQKIEQKEQDLSQSKEQLNNTKGQLSEIQGQKQHLQQEITALAEQKQDLESRIASIERQNPDRKTREQIHSDIERLKLDKSGLDGQIKSLQSQIEALESQKFSLQLLESKTNIKQAELEQLKEKYQNLQTKAQQLEQKATELELLRFTYDALFSERQSFEERVNQLRPEIERLELQKQKILQTIQASEQQYLKVEQQKEQSDRLAFEIKEKRTEIQRSERKVKGLEGVINGLEEEKANLEKKLQLIKGEINEIENSAAIALKALRTYLWTNFSTTPKIIDSSLSGEQSFLEGFSQFLAIKGFTFPDRVIKAFHTSLKVQDISALAILAGISGTGKSELPQRYADYIGAQMLTLAVQPRWDSPQDLQGFYNYVEKKYKPTDLMRGLYQYQNDPQMKDRIVVVLLDEMNLARVEYYFSDFLSKLETRRSKDTYLDLDVGSLPLPENERRLKIPHQFLFVGTMNEDETTQSLSDKVLDRANVLTFGKPQGLKLREEYRQNGTSVSHPQNYIPYSRFKEWIRKPNPDSEVVNKIRAYLDDANQIMEKLGHPFAHRVYQAITAYVVNYPGANEVDSIAFKAALADQFGQKLLPKLRGLMVDECHEELEQLFRVIKKIGDRSLEKAFERAKSGSFGQFQWRGFVYEEEQKPAFSIGG